jgi:acyl carrier protein
MPATVIPDGSKLSPEMRGNIDATRAIRSAGERIPIANSWSAAAVEHIGCYYCNTLKIFNRGHNAGQIRWLGCADHQGGLIMTGCTSTTEEEGFVTSKIRALIAEYSATDIDSITADTHFADDLGYDQLDVLDLIIMIENQFVDMKFSEEAEQMEFVGDLIRQIERVGAQGSKRGASGL